MFKLHFWIVMSCKNKLIIMLKYRCHDLFSENNYIEIYLVKPNVQVWQKLFLFGSQKHIL